MQKSRLDIYLLIIVAITIASCVSTIQNENSHLVIKEQGAFSAGGTVVKSEGTFDALKPWNVQQGGQTRHGDHADVFYQLPANAKRHSMVFLHGYGQSRRSWQTTADGREGFADIFLRKGYPVYLVDQPGRGAAGQTTKPGQITATPMIKHGLPNFESAYIPISTKEYNFRKIQHRLTSFTG